MKINETKAAELIGLPRVTIQRFKEEYINENGKKVQILKPLKEGNRCFYNESDMEKLWLIKMFKMLGKSQEEIVEALINPNFNKRVFLEETIETLNNYINISTNYLKTGMGYESIDILDYMENYSFMDVNEIINIVSQILNEKMENMLEDSKYENTFNGLDAISDLIENIICYKEEGLKYYNKIVQEHIDKFIDEYFDHKYYSRKILKSLAIMLKKGVELDDEADEEFDKVVRYFMLAVNYYIDNVAILKNREDLDVIMDLDKIEKLAYDKKTTGSVEIQKEINNMALYYYYTCFKSWEFSKELMNQLSIWFDDKDTRDKYDNGYEKGIFHFMSVAIKINVDNSNILNC